MSAKRGARSRAWSQRQATDPYVAQARARGFRSRAALKLEQLDKKDRLFRAGMTVVDLGAAPGSWSQYATSRVGPKGKVIALDRLEMAPITGIHMILGDFLESSVKEQVTVSLEGRPLDLVISDMAPNLTGIKDVDQVAMGELVSQAAVFAHSQLREHGVFVAKFFEGAEAKGVLDGLSERFESFRVRKPKASRSESTEVYVVARDPI
ncbi:MAG: RlmE family RNA methyltransferase [Gammaproteobacteria bacterium]|jgi:23S rRNA (uridine2552-2'-O)-methyltransferase|nr:RlmE family RNA methyltransferase [Gammaproteobacteria bacterium]NDA14912.1 RlmE family RNA methyltransferase [Gammaproteobacteria bacterium]NDG44306.1 RlmE family RNA methyltransferase [Gammaproteobacteria bacterium]